MDMMYNLPPTLVKVILILFFQFRKYLNPANLVLLSTSHHVEEEVYTALIDNGHALQKSYLICRERKGREGWAAGIELFYNRIQKHIFTTADKIMLMERRKNKQEDGNLTERMKEMREEQNKETGEKL